ncbi:SH3 domain-containing protein [Streptomyces resistomycificus]|uniref:SH3 domain-containing protein n=1 Tax=Streptomyces resistomycificus TaxID=67356 RepID=UPI0004ABACDF|nr:SH3 domain-containing protein [Streptomyces resistomycificus]
MRTTPALRTLTAVLLLSLIRQGSGGPVRGTVVSGTPLHVRAEPTTHAAVVDRLSPGSQVRVECEVRGQSVNKNPYWYWLVGAQGWVSADFVDTGGRGVPTCADPCPEWKNGTWNNVDRGDPTWNETWAVSSSGSWTVSGSGSWSASGSWSWSATGSSSGGWEWIPAG